MTTHAPRTYRRTLICQNPACKREFTPDADHRFGKFCCGMCAAKMTPKPHMTGQRVTPNLAQTIIAPHVNRKHGTDNRE